MRRLYYSYNNFVVLLKSLEDFLWFDEYRIRSKPKILKVSSLLDDPYLFMSNISGLDFGLIHLWDVHGFLFLKNHSIIFDINQYRIAGRKFTGQQADR